MMNEIADITTPAWPQIDTLGAYLAVTAALRVTSPIRELLQAIDDLADQLLPLEAALIVERVLTPRLRLTGAGE